MNTKPAKRSVDHVDIVVAARIARMEWFKSFFRSITTKTVSRYRTKPNPLIMRGLQIS